MCMYNGRLWHLENTSEFLPCAQFCSSTIFIHFPSLTKSLFFRFSKKDVYPVPSYIISIFPVWYFSIFFPFRRVFFLLFPSCKRWPSRIASCWTSVIWWMNRSYSKWNDGFEWSTKVWRFNVLRNHRWRWMGWVKGWEQNWYDSYKALEFLWWAWVSLIRWIFVCWWRASLVDA